MPSKSHNEASNQRHYEARYLADLKTRYAKKSTGKNGKSKYVKTKGLAKTGSSSHSNTYSNMDNSNDTHQIDTDQNDPDNSNENSNIDNSNDTDQHDTDQIDTDQNDPDNSYENSNIDNSNDTHQIDTDQNDTDQIDPDHLNENSNMDNANDTDQHDTDRIDPDHLNGNSNMDNANDTDQNVSTNTNEDLEVSHSDANINAEIQDKPRLIICINQLRSMFPCELKHMAIVDNVMHGCVSYHPYYEDKTEILDLNKDNYPLLEPVAGVPLAADLRKDAAKDKRKKDWQCPYCGYCSTKFNINRHINSREDEKNDGKFIRPSCTARRDVEPFPDNFAKWPKALRSPVKINNKRRKL